MVDRGARAPGADDARHPVRVSRPFDHRLGACLPFSSSMPLSRPARLFNQFLPAFDEVRHMVHTQETSALENRGVGRSTGRRSEEACAP